MATEINKLYVFDVIKNKENVLQIHFNSSVNFAKLNLALQQAEKVNYNVKLECAINGITSDLIFLADRNFNSGEYITFFFEKAIGITDLFLTFDKPVNAVPDISIFEAKRSNFEKWYPNITDLDLEKNHNLKTIDISIESSGHTEFSVYTSLDGENFDFLSKNCFDTNEGIKFVTVDADNRLARIIRVYLEYASGSPEAVVEKIEYSGEISREPLQYPQPINIPDFNDTEYNVKITENDTVNEVYGIIERQLGKEYKNWFVFKIGKTEKYDYFTLEDCEGKIKITANNGVSLAVGLNFYLKNYCKVHISQVGKQVRMPENIIKLNGKIHRETKTKIRYAYNYCTHSYTMAFWGEKEWRNEIDWLALNGVNAVLDITALEEVWRRFLGKIGYSLEEIKKYIVGPAFYAWGYMANMFGFGGPVHNSWFKERTALARKNQFSMRKLGMTPILQGYSGMVPIDLKKYDSEADVLPQGLWCNVRRPDMLKTTSPLFKKYAKLFYESQKEVYGEYSHYYAIDPFHEGGVIEGMSLPDISATVLNEMLKNDGQALWFVQGWGGNPKSEFLVGLNNVENGKDHVVVLDLYSEKLPRIIEGNAEAVAYGYSEEFDKTNWIFCMLNNFGGRMGLYGHLDNLVTRIPESLNTRKYNVGVGITPEASCNNPVLYEFLFDSIWQENADLPLEVIDISLWLKAYCERRYGISSPSCEKAFEIFKETVYKAELNMKGQGAPESVVNARPNFEIRSASSWGNSVIGYDAEELKKACALLLEDFNSLKECDTYLYDLTATLQQVLSNEAFIVHKEMVSAYNEKNIEKFKQYSEKFLNLIDDMEAVTSSNKDFMLGSWISKAEALSEDTDDFTRMLFKFNAKALVSTWGAYELAEDLHDYSNRQWSGLIETFYKPRWVHWINEVLKDMNGEEAELNPDWFGFEWNWVREERSFLNAPKVCDFRKILNNYK